jgi:hypothetical protein
MVQEVIKPPNPLDQFICDSDIVPPYSASLNKVEININEDYPILSSFFSSEHLNSISNIEEIRCNLFRMDSCLNQSCVIDRSKN